MAMRSSPAGYTRHFDKCRGVEVSCTSLATKRASSLSTHKSYELKKVDDRALQDRPICLTLKCTRDSLWPGVYITPARVAKNDSTPAAIIAIRRSLKAPPRNHVISFSPRGSFPFQTLHR